VPDISIIIPCYNEEKTIAQVLSAILEQSIDINTCEVVIADGLSSDRTRDAIEEFSKAHRELYVRVVDNPKRHIPAALNTAIKAAKGQYIVRLDAHCTPERTYIERCIDHLKKETADNIGGIWIIEPGDTTPTAKAIASAASNAIGTGNAAYRQAGSHEGFIDTVPFGSFHRSLFDKIGLYDENLLSNEDYDLNVRIRKTGGHVYLDPKIQCIYFARTTLKGLAKQYWRYGFWKVKMLSKYPESIRWRQALPPLFVLGLVGLLGISIFLPTLLLLVAALLLLYLALVAFSVVTDKRSKELVFNEKILSAAAVITMHFSWASGFLVSLGQLVVKKKHAD
jgi:glycosyltransferase involved in cell wall biosynthesis